MVIEFDLPCSRCGGEVVPVEVSVAEQLGNESETMHLGECVECGTQHYPEQALDSISG